MWCKQLTKAVLFVPPRFSLAARGLLQTKAARTTPAAQPSQPAVLQTSVEPSPQVRPLPAAPEPLGTPASTGLLTGQLRVISSACIFEAHLGGDTRVQPFLYLLPCPSGGRACFALCPVPSANPGMCPANAFSLVLMSGHAQYLTARTTSSKELRLLGERIFSQNTKQVEEILTRCGRQLGRELSWKAREPCSPL